MVLLGIEPRTSCVLSACPTPGHRLPPGDTVTLLAFEDLCEKISQSTRKASFLKKLLFGFRVVRISFLLCPAF